MLSIQKKLSTNNCYLNSNRPKYIVIHDTDNFDSEANAERHASAQFNGNLSTSVHFYVDDHSIYQSLDINHGSWSVGVKYGTPSIKDVTNYNTINIELCVNPENDYDKTRRNAIELVRYLMKETQIPVDRVIRHYDCCVKKCPATMINNPALWDDFKYRIALPEEKPTYYRIVTGGFSDLDKLSNAINTYFKGINIYLSWKDGNYYLETGDFNSRGEANNYAQKFAQDKYYYEIKTVQY